MLHALISLTLGGKRGTNEWALELRQRLDTRDRNELLQTR
jgi:hypothetical protein